MDLQADDRFHRLTAALMTAAATGPASEPPVADCDVCDPPSITTAMATLGSLMSVP